MSPMVGEALRVVDLVSCWTILSLSAMLLFSLNVHSTRQLLFGIGLLAAVVGAFIGSVVVWETGHRAPWAVAQRLGHATVLVWLWDARFGIKAQFERMRTCLFGLPARVKAFWHALREGRLT